MAGSLPTVRGGAAQALYPVIRSVEFSTGLGVAVNGTEQRWKKRPPLTRFALQYTRVPAGEMAAMRTFFNSQKGAFDSTWTFTLGAITYSHLAFDDDEFTAVEEAATPTLYSFALKFRQTQNSGAATPTVTSFPTLLSGATAQLPYAQTRRFYTMKNDNPNGPRYSYPFYGGGLTGFPTGALMGWQLTFNMLPDVDLATLENFFRGVCGMWGQFSFTDPDDASVHTKCRFGSDVMEIHHVDPAYSQTVLTIRETF